MIESISTLHKLSDFTQTTAASLIEVPLILIIITIQLLSTNTIAGVRIPLETWCTFTHKLAAAVTFLKNFNGY